MGVPPRKKERLSLNMALLAQKLPRIFFCQNPFPGGRGGGKGLSATKKRTIFAASLIRVLIMII